MDVTDIQSVEKSIAQIIEEFGKIDVLVNNAGIYHTDPLEATSAEKVDVVIKTNVYGGS